MTQDAVLALLNITVSLVTFLSWISIQIHYNRMHKKCSWGNSASYDGRIDTHLSHCIMQVLLVTSRTRCCCFCHFSCLLRSSSGSQDQRLEDALIGGTVICRRWRGGLKQRPGSRRHTRCLHVVSRSSPPAACNKHWLHYSRLAWRRLIPLEESREKKKDHAVIVSGRIKKNQGSKKERNPGALHFSNVDSLIKLSTCFSEPSTNLWLRMTRETTRAIDVFNMPRATRSNFTHVDTLIFSIRQNPVVDI